MQLAEVLVASLIAVLLTILSVYLGSLARWRARTRGRPVPPGPKPLPILGNIFDMPKVRPWIGLRVLCLEYGDLLYFWKLNHSHLVLGSPEVILEFMGKRSANCSDRMVTTSCHLTGFDWAFGLLPYGEAWRRARSAFWQHFRPKASAGLRPIQRAAAHKFLAKLLDSPANFQQLVRFTFSASMMKIVYGMDLEDENDPSVRLIDAAMEAAAQVLVPGKFLVDSIPFLRHVPSWVPGAGFQKQFAGYKAEIERLKHIPFDQCQKLPNAPTCIVNSLLDRLKMGSGERSSDAEEFVKCVATVTFLTGSDTTFSALQTTFLAMSLYPEIQKKAQAELDAVVGPDRLPDFSDYESLVYVSAIIKESDDEFRGYFIPAGTVLTANIWACLHDPEVYPDPDVFRPDRFLKDGKLDPTVRDPYAFAFGFGRRICPGRYFADAALFINVASVLHAFDIGPAVDEAGEPVAIVPRMTDSVLSYPEDCRCTVKPRSEAAAALIRAAQVKDAK